MQCQINNNTCPDPDIRQASATADLFILNLIIHVQNTPDMNEMEATATYRFCGR